MEQKNLGSHLKEESKETKAFHYLKRGELISIENPLEKGAQLDIVLGTTIQIKAALGKAVD